MGAERNWGFIRGNRYGSIYDRGPDLFVMEELPSQNETGKGRKNGKILDFPAAGRNKKKQKSSRNEKNGSDTGTGDIIPFFLRDKSLDFSREFFEEDLDDDETEDLLARRILLRLVENQLEKKDPPFVSEAYAALQKKGYLKKQAKIRLTEALALELAEEDKTGKPDFSLERYAGFVEKAAAEPGDPEEIPDLETGRERQIRKQLEEFEDAYDESDDDLAADIFTEIWPDIKADAEDNYTRETDSGTEKSTVYDIDALQDFRLNLAENIEETVDIFQGCRRYLDGVRIFQEILDTFAWEDGDDDDLRGNLSWFYEEAGMPEEAEKILKDWYETSPDNPVCTYYYVELYRNRKDLQQARRILEEHLPQQQAVDENSVDLYHSAAELYQELGEPEKAEHYQKLADHLEDSVRKFFNKEMQLLAEALQDDWDITPDFWKDEE